MRALTPVLMMVVFALCSRADTYIRQPAVDVVHYDISLDLTDNSDSINATAKIHVRIRGESVSRMRLDFAGMKMESLRIHGKPRQFTCRNGSLWFDLDRIYNPDEIAIVEIRYHGKPDRGFLIGKNRHGRRVFFTENWPDSAHHWIPSIDHPSDKASVRMTVAAPLKYSVVSNGRLLKEERLSNGRKSTQWLESKAIPTYCIALGVAEFSIVHQPDYNGVPVDWYTYREDAEFAARKFRSTRAALEYFSSLIAPYPYEKLAQVEATVAFDGMENASAIFYAESSIRKSPGTDEPVPHEIAHQWFGDSVTQSDWDHLWLSEGFATYFEALFYEHISGAETLKQTMDGYALRLLGDKSAQQAPIIDPAQTDLVKKLNLLNYDKGAWVLHMLRGVMGDDCFFKGIRRYYRSYEGLNTTSEGLRITMEEACGNSLAVFFNQWLHQAGWPEYEIEWHWNEADGAVEISIRQAQATGLFDAALEIAFAGEGWTEIRKFRIFERKHSLQIQLKSKPSAIQVDPNEWILKSLSIKELP